MQRGHPRRAEGPLEGGVARAGTWSRGAGLPAKALGKAPVPPVREGAMGVAGQRRRAKRTHTYMPTMIFLVWGIFGFH